MCLPKTATTIKGKKSKEKIYNAAINLINLNGYEKTTVKDICKRANIAVGTFYHYFKSKQDVLIKYVKEESLDLEKYYSNLKYKSYIDRLRDVIDYQLNYYNKKGQEFVSKIFVIEIINKKQIFKLDEYSLINITLECINNGQNNGEISKKITAKEICYILNDYMIGLVIEWISSNSYFDFKKFAQPKINLLIDMFIEK